MDLIIIILAYLIPAIIIALIIHKMETWNTIKCPYCQERINKKAIKCKHCHSSLK